MPITNFSNTPIYSKNDLIAQLKDLVGDTVQLELLAHGAHVNVSSADFPQYHALFGMIYADAQDARDDLLEGIRRLNALAPASIEDYLESPDELKEQAPATGVDPLALAKSVYVANEDCLECVVKGSILANALNEQGIVNMLAERQDKHSKWQWQLRQTVGDAFADSQQVDPATVIPGEENEA